MSELFEEIKRINPTSEIDMYFTTEKFTTRNGYHNHIIIHIENKTWVVETIIREYLFKDNIVDFQPYDKYNSGLLYIAKEGRKGTDWDYFTTKGDKK